MHYGTNMSAATYGSHKHHNDCCQHGFTDHRFQGPPGIRCKTAIVLENHEKTNTIQAETAIQILHMIDLDAKEHT